MVPGIIAGSLASATVADLQRAEHYHGVAAWVTRHGEGGERWVFDRVDGGSDSFTRSDLRQSVWWRFCDADDVLCLEYQLRPRGSWSDRFAELPISFVARSDRFAGGMLAAGSRLSDYFEGEVGYEAASGLCAELRARHPAAAVFQFATIAEAERALQGVDTHAERLEQRKCEIRAEQAAARARLGFGPSTAASVQPTTLPQGA
jgi:hypothetical protein